MAHITSSAAPAGSILFSIFALLVISVIVLLILRYYLPLRTTPGFYLVPIFFALWLPSIVVLLVPIDLASSAATNDETTRGIWLPERVVLVSWRITYWLTFVLTWAILPILGEYSDAGYHEPNDKLKYSLRQNAQFYAIVLGASAVGLVYFFIAYNPSLLSVQSLVMTLAYCWGLVLAIYLMGHGLVAIPRRLIRNASISGRLRRLQSRAPKVRERMEDTLVILEEVEAQVAELCRRKTGSALSFQEWIEELQDMGNIVPSQVPSGFSTFGASGRSIPPVITEKYLADLTRGFVRARHARSRYVDEWNGLVHEAGELQMILDSAASKKLNFGEPSPHAGVCERTRILSPYTRYIFYYHVVPYSQVAFGLFLAVASACVVWSELVRYTFPQLSVIRLSVVHHWVGDKPEVGFAGQVVSAFWISYMCAAALLSMTEVKVWRGRALVKRNTAYESAFWYSMQVAKLTIPLSYNFVTFLSKEVYEKTIFFKFLGQLLEKTAPGRWFDDLFPIVVLFPVVATLFGLYGKVKRVFVGIDVIDEGDENGPAYGTGSWREGRALIERELEGTAIYRRRGDTASSVALGGRGNRPAPTLSIPAVRNHAAAPSRSPLSPSNNRRPGQAPRAPLSDEGMEDDNMLVIIGNRVKNTFEGMEAPKWFQDIKKPKWMGGDNDNAGNSQDNSNIRRWFGGDGHIRL
ncbi:LMBR1-like membrane protein [Metarhizium album ARSEF 1941]|uniref:LMBR1-like membrane protein n=1 Tax=Metarhizium album (strain ARSEF 1941) TaxID=1081103 RepID=A0A0B2X0Y8_METAS|nr:LMBR1-like membrane protein [Metarhizium album ARSEF 1941]KHN99539.1 LMBR1-like membrane protein [Metarhizium album ARSEF 1941]